MDISFDFFLKKAKQDHPSLLEIATGPGNITKYLLARNKTAHLLGTDIAPNMIKLAQSNNPSARFEIMDCRDLSSLPNLFDGVMIGFCLPYLNYDETSKLIREVSTKLHNGGVVYLSTIEAPYKTSGWTTGSQGDRVFMHYYEEKDLAKMLTASGLSIQFSRKYTYLDSKKEDVNDLVIIASKNG